MGSDSNVRHHRPPEITWDLGCKVGSLLLMAAYGIPVGAVCP